MINHIVMWKFKDFAENADKKTNMEMAKQKLLALKDKIEEIEFIEIGINLTESTTAYDMVLNSKFKDMQALLIYQNHPEHLKVRDFIGKVRDARAVVDYELD